MKGDSSIEQISHVYGKQAVVVSVDPRRVSIFARFAAVVATGVVTVVAAVVVFVAVGILVSFVAVVVVVVTSFKNCYCYHFYASIFDWISSSTSASYSIFNFKKIPTLGL